MIVESVRLSESAKRQLITLKRRTGVKTWNVLCRWALIASIKEENSPVIESIKTDSSIEIAWATFSGELGETLSTLIRSKHIGESGELRSVPIEDYFKLHLHRGISLLVERCERSLFDALHI